MSEISFPAKSKLLPHQQKFAKKIFIEIKEAFADEELMTKSLTGKGKFGMLDKEKISLIKKNTLAELGVASRDWDVCLPKVKELLRDHRKRLK